MRRPVLRGLDDDRVGRAKRTERRDDEDDGRADTHTQSGDGDGDAEEEERDVECCEKGFERWRTLWRRNEGGWRRKTR